MLAWDKEVPLDGRWIASPQPRGMSGGGLVVVRDSLSPDGERIAKLSAILKEHRKAKHDLPPVLVGARIGLHLSLIGKYLPKIADSMQARIRRTGE